MNRQMHDMQRRDSWKFRSFFEVFVSIDDKKKQSNNEHDFANKKEILHETEACYMHV